MSNGDFYMKPKGEIQIVLHNGGTYNIKTNTFSPDAEIIKMVDIPNLIVSDASILMAMRMAPGEKPTKYTEPTYPGDVFDINKKSFTDYGLTHLAIGTGKYDNITLGINKLQSETTRKEFNAWSFIKQDGTSSVTPTNILKLSTTFTDEPHGGTTSTVAISEMGLFGGTLQLAKYMDNSVEEKNVDKKDGGVMFNYKSFEVWNKPHNSSLTINWKITF